MVEQHLNIDPSVLASADGSRSENNEAGVCCCATGTRTNRLKTV